jgi:hypothetical protein
MAAFLRPILPVGAFWRLHGFVAAVITPFRFSYLTGHFRSSIVHRPIDGGGRPSLWMTYPVINFLEGKDFKEKRVLEWGSGQSTLWWSRRAKEVVSFESDSSWFELVRSRAPGNVKIHLVNENIDGLPSEWLDGKFDLIVVDGLDRVACARASVGLLAEDGALIMDDAEQPWSPQGFPIIDLMRERGFQRIDFFGHAPAVIRRHCTSVFFKQNCFLLLGTEIPRRYD